MKKTVTSHIKSAFEKIKKFDISKMSYRNIFYEIKHHFKSLDRRLLVMMHDLTAIFAAMHIAFHLILGQEISLLLPGFILKQSLIFAFIAGGFFIWFQTYKGVWRYVSMRQGALLLAVLGGASIIYMPILTKAHMQPVVIPASLVFANWLIATAVIVGSRVFVRIFYDRWISVDDSNIASIPLARVLLLGTERELTLCIDKIENQVPKLYEIEGVINTADKKTGSYINGVEVLGTVTDLPDLIENFNAEGMHPHHIVIAGPTFLGKRAKALVTILEGHNLSFMKFESNVVKPLIIEDLFYQPMAEGDLYSFNNKNLLVYGTATKLALRFIETICAKTSATIYLCEQNVRKLTEVIELLPNSKVKVLTTSDANDARLESALRDNKIDTIINLKSFAADMVEDVIPQHSFDTYLKENARLTTIARASGVTHYFFVTQTSLHCTLANKLAPLANKVLTKCSHASDITCTNISLPYIADHSDRLFDKSIPLDDNEQEMSLAVVNPQNAASLLANSISDTFITGHTNKETPLAADNISYAKFIKLHRNITNSAQLANNRKINLGAKPDLKGGSDLLTNIIDLIDQRDYEGAGVQLQKIYV